MPKLTDTQSTILSRAATRPDNLAMPLPEGLAGAAAKMAIGKMIERGWLEEVEANLRRGEPIWRETGDGHGTTLIATEAGETTTYALVMVQERGKLFIGPGEQVYEGMIVGENPRNEDIACNAVREKKLTNFRSQGEGVGVGLTPATKLSLERAIEYIATDEFVEVTPKSIRLRKVALDPNERKKQMRAAKAG